MLPGHSKIDLFERFAQTFYCGMLLGAPSYWLEDNFKNPPMGKHNLSTGLKLLVLVLPLLDVLHAQSLGWP